MRRVLIAGGSGLVGSEFIAALLADAASDWDLVAPTRRAFEFSHPRLFNPALDLMSMSEFQLLNAFSAVDTGRYDAFVCTLGSTRAKAGSRAQFYAIDHGLVLRLAQTARALGARHVLLVSSVGAHSKSSSFYLRVKGDVERGINELGFDRTDVLRPAQLLGARNEARPMERLAQWAAKHYSPWLQGEARRYRAIEASAVGRALRGLLERTGSGSFIHYHDALLEAASIEFPS